MSTLRKVRAAVEHEFHALAYRLISPNDAIKTMGQSLEATEQELEKVLAALEPTSLCDATELGKRLAVGLHGLQDTVGKQVDTMFETTEEDASAVSNMALVSELGADAVMVLLEKVCVKVQELSEPLLHEFALALRVQASEAEGDVKRAKIKARALLSRLRAVLQLSLDAKFRSRVQRHTASLLNKLQATCIRHGIRKRQCVAQQACFETCTLGHAIHVQRL